MKKTFFSTNSKNPILLLIFCLVLSFSGCKKDNVTKEQSPEDQIEILINKYGFRRVDKKIFRKALYQLTFQRKK